MIQFDEHIFQVGWKKPPTSEPGSQIGSLMKIHWVTNNRSPFWPSSSRGLLETLRAEAPKIEGTSGGLHVFGGNDDIGHSPMMGIHGIGILIYIFSIKNQANLGKLSIHGSYGGSWCWFLSAQKGERKQHVIAMWMVLVSKHNYKDGLFTHVLANVVVAAGIVFTFLRCQIFCFNDAWKRKGTIFEGFKPEHRGKNRFQLHIYHTFGVTIGICLFLA